VTVSWTFSWTIH